MCGSVVCRSAVVVGLDARSLVVRLYGSVVSGGPVFKRVDLLTGFFLRILRRLLLIYSICSEIFLSDFEDGLSAEVRASF